MFFKLEATDNKARAGTITTAHGEIETPIFMPVGTRASVKCIWPDELDELGAQIILGNTYHLYLRPGHELIEKVGGGLHGFMNYHKPILTDSGGFQVFSLSKLNKITEEGVTFKSHLDGSSHMISPEKSMEIQKALGSDIVMAFDECPALPSTYESIEKSLALTTRWAKRCKDFELKDHQHLFGIIQGGLELDLRERSLSELEEIGFDGLAIGGLSVGEKNNQMYELLDQFIYKMPSQKPRYLMGVGAPIDLLEAIRSGVDMFDCVLPTRNARNGQFLTHRGPLNIKKEMFKYDTLPPDPECDCKVCRNFSRSYIRHLYTTGEYLAGQMISFHNLHFLVNLTRRARAAIKESKFDDFFRSSYNSYKENTYR